MVEVKSKDVEPFVDSSDLSIYVSNIDKEPSRKVNDLTVKKNKNMGGLVTNFVFKNSIENDIYASDLKIDPSTKEKNFSIFLAIESVQGCQIKIKVEHCSDRAANKEQLELLDKI